uniref:ATP-binding cassette sub-family D member 4, peroxisomal membrane n=1 Tax=Lepeophtheirus salmonis TaxID=72036 RepID=A0A0K2TDG6_LEPSM
MISNLNNSHFPFIIMISNLNNSHFPPLTRNYKVNWEFIKRIFTIHKIIFSKWTSVLIFILLIAVCGLEQFLAYNTGLIAGNFYEVLLNKDMKGFQMQVLISMGFIMGIAVAMTFRMYVSNILSLFFRAILTRRLHGSYFNENEFYRINVILRELHIDNPDQRMTADIDIFCRAYGDMMSRLITSPFVIAYYSWDAYTRAGWTGPVGVYVFFLLGTFINILLMSPLSKKVFNLERREGDFRYKHVFVRDHSEEMAIMSASKREYKSTNDKLKKLVVAQQSLYNREAFLDLSTNLFNYMGAILSYLIIAVPIFMGYYDYMDKATLGKQISQNSFVCMTLVYNFTQLIDLATKVANMSGVTHRIVELLEVMDEEPEESSYQDCLEYRTHVLQSRGGEEEVVLINNVTLTPPFSDRILIENLDLKILKGQRLLITGSSSSGKTSILRHIRGLWKARIGRTVVNAKKVYYLPQNPIFTDGSLIENMIYPSERDPTLDDSWFIEQLIALELNHLLERYSLRADRSHWVDILSPGEMQRICFIRIFYHAPDLIILDEATSSLPTCAEGVIYEKLDQTFSDATIISVGHRESLREFHDLELQLTNGRTWSLIDLNQSRIEEEEKQRSLSSCSSPDT